MAHDKHAQLGAKPPALVVGGARGVTAKPEPGDDPGRALPLNGQTETAAPGAEPPPPPTLEADVRAGPSRRVARRRPAGPARNRVAANDDAPSIGGLIFALEQKPSNKPFRYAGIAAVVWALFGGAFAFLALAPEFAAGAGFVAIITKPTTFLTLAAIIVPIAVLWFLALLACRAEELRLRSSTMTEVAVRLAEPDRMAEQAVASLGQSVRRQVGFMNDAVSRALGRAGELEALVHNEVAALERSYEENERKVRSLIQELAGERHALLNTSESVTANLRGLGTEIPALIEKMTNQQVKLAQIIQGAGDNLTALEGAIGQSTHRLEETLGGHSNHLQGVLEGYTTALAAALANRTEHMQSIFEDYARALDASLADRAQSLDMQLVERTRSLDAAFSERLLLFDESILRSTAAIDSAIAEKAELLTAALDSHAKTFRETIGRQATELDESLMHGIHAVRRTSENITRQSLKAIEGLANQSDLLKNVSENLLGQINTVTGRFETQGQSIMKAANALETANYKIDTTLQSRHADLSHTLDRLAGKADEFGRVIEGYSSSIEGSLSEAEFRARAAAEELRSGAETHSRAALADIERMKSEAAAESDRALADLRHRFSTVSTEVTQQLGSLTDQFSETTEEVRERAARAAADIAAEQARLREQLERLPATTRESTDAVRRSLQDQLNALDQLSQMTSRGAVQRDVTPPLVAGPPNIGQTRAISSLTSTLTQETGARGRSASTSGRERWSLGDLLARASYDDDGSTNAAQSSNPFFLNVDIIARAIDPATASAIWSRLRAGKRGIMVRSIYSTDGRVAFDEVSRRINADADLARTVDRYLADFEQILREAESQDPSGRLSQNHLVSDTGRVYLFLAHASGRLA